MTRTGIGYDSHRLVEGRQLVLAGVEIDSELGLAGHSDADVVAHAVSDALLGAAGLADIGAHFPDSDPAHRNADSLGLLARVGELVARERLAVTWIDATVICERPRLGPHRDAMRERLGAALGIAAASVSVKFTTNEGMGAIGRGEGIAALAVATVEG